MVVPAMNPNPFEGLKARIARRLAELATEAEQEFRATENSQNRATGYASGAMIKVMAGK
jgi:phosphotransferase system HPr-like phosphotransfer protein